jgi:hypothetical protein
VHKLLAIAAALAVTVSASARAEKKRDVAKVLSSGGAAVSGALVVTAFLIADPNDYINRPLFYTGAGLSLLTPSFGEWYAGEWITPGMAARVVSLGLATVALTHEQETTACNSGATNGQQCQSLTGAGFALLGLAAIGFVGGIWYDALDAPDAVDRYNQRHGLSLAPAAMPVPGGAPGQVAPGLMLGGRF